MYVRMFRRNTCGRFARLSPDLFLRSVGEAIRSRGSRRVALTLCPPIEREPALPRDPALTDDHLKCVVHDKAVMSYVMSRPDIKTVFMAAAWQNYQNHSARNSGPNGHGFTPYQFDDELTSTIGKLTDAGKHVILMDDVPTIPMNLINCDFKNDLFIPRHKQACEFDASRARDEHAPVAAMLDKLKSKYRLGRSSSPSSRGEHLTHLSGALRSSQLTHAAGCRARSSVPRRAQVRVSHAFPHPVRARAPQFLSERRMVRSNQALYFSTSFIPVSTTMRFWAPLSCRSARAVDDRAAIRREAVARQKLRIPGREEQNNGRNVFFRRSEAG